MVQSPRRTRRLCTFTTRTLLVVVTLIAVMCALFGKRLLRARQERIAITEIERVGGRVGYEYSDVFAHESRVTRWLGHAFYEDASRVTGVDLIGPGVTDATLQQLTSLTQIEGVAINRANVTDAGLKYLQKPPRLKRVYLYKTRVTEAGIRELRGVKPSLQVYW